MWLLQKGTRLPTIAKHARVPAIAAFDSGNLLAVATAIRERHRDKQIIIAGDDDHRLDNNPGRSKALEAAAAVNGVVVFPDLSAEQRGQGMTDFNDLARENPELVSRQLSNVLQQTHQKPLEQSTSVELTASSR
jgi:putative DNA primase/helicase